MGNKVETPVAEAKRRIAGLFVAVCRLDTVGEVEFIGDDRKDKCILNAYVRIRNGPIVQVMKDFKTTLSKEELLKIIYDETINWKVKAYTNRSEHMPKSTDFGGFAHRLRNR